MIPTWIVWSPMPPECREKISCVSPLDAGRAWAERAFRNGMLARTGTEVLVRCESDPVVLRSSPGDSRPPKLQPSALSATTYQVKLTIVDTPAFRASLVGVVFEANREVPHG